MTLLLALACATEPPATDDTADTADTAPAGPAALTDASNYSYTAALEVERTPITADGSSVLDWSTLTTDLRGFSMDPAQDVTGLSLVWFRDLTPDEAQDALIAGEITQASVGLYALGLPGAGATSVTLGSLDLYGTPFDPGEYMLAEGGSWLVRLSTVHNSEAMLLFLEPPVGATRAALTPDSAVLDFRPDLASLTPVRLSGTEVEWTTLTRDGRGDPLDPLEVQELWIARYDGLDVATLQERFFELEKLATGTWTVNVYGEDGVDLSTAMDADGGAFPGLSADATWLLALRCMLCTSPAPVYLTVLEAG